MPSTTRKRSTAANRVQHAATAASSSVFDFDSEEETSSRSAAAPNRGRSGKAPLRAAPPAALYTPLAQTSPKWADLSSEHLITCMAQRSPG